MTLDQSDIELKIQGVIESVRGSNIASILTIVSGIVQIINDSRSNARDLKELIELDPPLSGKLLRISNSAYYAPPNKIESIEKAIIWIGYDKVKETAMNQKVREIFSENQMIDGHKISELWLYSVGVAHLSKMIYRREFRENGDSIYTAGLLHKIGLIAEIQFLKDELFKNITRSNEAGLVLIDTERANQGFSHVELGQRITESWSLSEGITSVIGHHVNPYLAPQEFFKPCATLYLAGVMCRESGIGYFNATPFDEGLYLKCKQDLNIDQDALDLILEEGNNEIQRMVEKGAF